MSNSMDAVARTQSWFAFVLAFIAGYVDSFTLSNFQVYSSFMSGNSTQVGLNAGQGRLAEAGHRLLPIPCFVAGAAVATLLQNRLRRPERGLCGIVATLLLAGAAATQLGPFSLWCDVILLSFAMGVMNAVVTRVGGQPVGLGFVTGDLNNLGRHLGLAADHVPLSDSQAFWDTRWRRIGVLGSVWGAFVIGACVSGAGMLVIGSWILLPPVAVLAWLAWASSVLDASPTGSDAARGRMAPRLG